MPSRPRWSPSVTDVTDRTRPPALLGAVAAAIALGSLAALSPVVAMWAVAAALGSLVSVPAPGGRSVSVAPGVLFAACPVFDAALPLLAVWALAAVGYVLVAVVAPRARRASADVATGVVVVVVFAVVDASFHARDFLGPGKMVAALSAAGLAWYLARTLYGAVAGIRAPDGSFRYDWLVGLHDWPAAVTVLAPGGLLGLAQSEMGWWWATVMAVMLHGFGHITAVRRRRIERTYEQTIRALSRVPEVADLVPPGHVERTAEIAGAVARRCGHPPLMVQRIEHAALLHDVGAVAAAAVAAPRTEHDLAVWGAEIVGAIPTLGAVARVIADQDRAYREDDGSTAPLAAGARIVRAAAAYQARIDAGRSPLDALQELFRGASHDFDPEIVNEMRRYLIERGELTG
jgi:hypothetical protein